MSDVQGELRRNKQQACLKPQRINLCKMCGSSLLQLVRSPALSCCSEEHTMWRRHSTGGRGGGGANGYLIFLLCRLALYCSLFTCSTACSNGNCQLLDSCASAADCGPSLYCGNCPELGKNQPFCIRGQAIEPTSIISGLPFNKYSWLVTHNAFSMVNAPLLTGPQRITFYNQEDTVTNQLREPAINTLKEVEAFLSANPTEIVTIIIEDYVHSPKGLTRVFADAGLDKYWFPVSKMPKKGDDWPTVNDMVKKNYRFLVFTSDSSKEAAEGIAYQWRYMVENEPGDPGVVPGSCSSRKESKALNSRSASLFLMNYFPTVAVQNGACKEHSTQLVDMVGSCYKAAGNMMPNYVAVNFYMRSDGGGVFEVLDQMNGHTLCGCPTVTACQAGVHFGVCRNTTAPNATPTATNNAGMFSGSVQLTGHASAIHFSSILYLFSLSSVMLLFLL